MQTCERCEREKVIDVVIDDSMDVCGHTFTTQMPATRCLACQQVVIQGEHVRRFERRVAAEIAKAGLRASEAFRFLRTTLGLSDASFADLLDVPVDYVGYWESGKWPVDPRALAVLAGLVLAAFEGKHSALDSLRVLRAPRKLARKVRLHLDGAFQQAGKLLQFGSTVFTQPAVA
jgi:putative zinc finger/helix-turn-helix YgiT family protein